MLQFAIMKPEQPKELSRKFRLNSEIKLPKAVKVAGIVLLIGIPSIMIGYAFLALVFHIGNITPEQANQKCQEFYDGVKAQLDSTAGYTVVKADKRCTPIQDELGSTDYNQHASFVVSGGDNTSVEAVKNNLNLLGKQLKAEAFNLSLYNIPPSGGQPPAICVSAYRYIDNDGKVYSQGIDGVMPRYLEPGSQGSLASYEDCRA